MLRRTFNKLVGSFFAVGGLVKVAPETIEQKAPLKIEPVPPSVQVFQSPVGGIAPGGWAECQVLKVRDGQLIDTGTKIVVHTPDWLRFGSSVCVNGERIGIANYHCGKGWVVSAEDCGHSMFMRSV